MKKSASLFKNFYYWSKKYINYKMGLIGAVITGSIAFASNYSHGFSPAAYAFGKQAVFVLFFGGYNIKTCEKMSEKFKSKFLSLTAATLVPALQAAIAFYILHKIGGTPEPTITALAASAANLPPFFVFGYNYRKHHEKGTKGILHQKE
jgi:uncharacterized membrane protein YfcA